MGPDQGAGDELRRDQDLSDLGRRLPSYGRSDDLRSQQVRGSIQHRAGGGHWNQAGA